MSITDRQRREVFTSLEATHGETIANTIMELLPNQPADQLVTRTDMHAFGTELRGEMAELRGEMAELRAELRGEMAELRAELRGEMAELRTELRGEMAELRGEMIKRFATAKVDTQRLIMASMAANAIAVITALVA